MVKIKNLTPHEVCFMLEDGKVYSIPPSGTVARCEVKRERVGFLSVDGIKIPVNDTAFGQIENLPEPEEGTVYIVSSIVAQAVAATAPHRTDIFIVDDTVRDEKGRIVGVRAVVRLQ